MFAIGFLLVLVVSLIVFHFLTWIFPQKVRPYLWLTVITLAFSFPFWHYLYPSYQVFNALCEQPDRHVVLKTVEVDYAYSYNDSFWAYRKLENFGFKGFEIEQGRLGYFRYARNHKWPLADCQRDCATPSVFMWEKTCEKHCLTKTPILAPEFKYTSNYSTTELIESRLSRQRQAMITPSGEELVVTLNYTYFPYGTGAAKILGLASGSAPSISCPTETNIEMHEFLRPRPSK